MHTRNKKNEPKKKSHSTVMHLLDLLKPMPFGLSSANGRIL